MKLVEMWRLGGGKTSEIREGEVGGVIIGGMVKILSAKKILWNLLTR